MQKRRVYFALVVLVLAGVLFLVLRLEREPEYGGKKLSEWVPQTCPPVPSSPFPPPKPWQVPDEVEEAIRHIGTNGIPFLVRWVGYEPPSWNTKVRDFLRRKFHYAVEDHDRLRANGAMRALHILGPEAEGAVPGLALLMNDTHFANRASRATTALLLLGSLISVDIALLTNNAPKARFEGIRRLSFSGVQAIPAVPALARCLQDTDAGVAAEAALALGFLAIQPGIEPRLAVPALTESLEDRRAVVRQAAAEGLQRFSLGAESAGPALLKLLEDPVLTVREAASNALQKIAPEKLEKATQ